MEEALSFIKTKNYGRWLKLYKINNETCINFLKL